MQVPRRREEASMPYTVIYDLMSGAKFRGSMNHEDKRVRSLLVSERKDYNAHFSGSSVRTIVVNKRLSLATAKHSRLRYERRCVRCTRRAILVFVE